MQRKFKLRSKISSLVEFSCMQEFLEENEKFLMWKILKVKNSRTRSNRNVRTGVDVNGSLLTKVRRGMETFSHLNYYRISPISVTTCNFENLSPLAEIVRHDICAVMFTNSNTWYGWYSILELQYIFLFTYARLKRRRYKTNVEENIETSL